MMGYIKFSETDFQEPKQQINILALFGNGIDMQLMEFLNAPYRTSYQNFYKYLCYKNFDKSNMLFKKWQRIKKKMTVIQMRKQTGVTLNLV